jgi:hypothetical protein
MTRFRKFTLATILALAGLSAVATLTPSYAFVDTHCAGGMC